MLKKLRLFQLKRMIGLLKSRKYVYFFGLLGGMTGQISFIIVSAFVKKKMINAAIRGQIAIILNSIYLILTVIILGCIFDPLARYICNWCIRKTMKELRFALFSHIAKLSMSYFDDTHSGEVMARINNDLNVMEKAYGWQMHMLLLSIIAGIGSLISMFILDWRLTILVIILGLASVLVNIFFANSLKTISELIQVESSELIQSLVNILTGLRTIKMFNIGSIMIQRFIDKNESVAKTQMLKIKKKSVMDCLNFFFSNLNLLGILLIGSIMVANELTDFGTVLAIIYLQTGLDFLLYQFSNYLVQYQQAIAGANRVFELLDHSIEPEKYIITNNSNQRDMIVFDDVYFGYNNKQFILNSLNLRIKKGEHIALVGLSGAGKSTIIKLLLGFYPINSGSIVVQGKSLGEYTLEELRELITYVPQDVHLFTGTIEQNIYFVEPTVNKEEIRAVAKATLADKFIMNLPERYQTKVRMMGNSLSGGQKQRIAIARALLKDAPIVLFDEAASALDSESEHQLRLGISELLRGRTVITIAHRLSTIVNADQIYLIENGRVIERGKHKELLQKSGVYQLLYNQQYK